MVPGAPLEGTVLVQGRPDLARVMSLLCSMFKNIGEEDPLLLHPEMHPSYDAVMLVSHLSSHVPSLS